MMTIEFLKMYGFLGAGEVFYIITTEITFKDIVQSAKIIQNIYC